MSTSSGKTSSRTTADIIVGEHEHTIVGYSLLKGIGDGEPVASDRFNVGGHDWVLLFYPDGKRSSNMEHHPHHVDPRAVPGAPPLLRLDGEGNALPGAPQHGAAAPRERDQQAPADRGTSYSHRAGWSHDPVDVP